MKYKIILIVLGILVSRPALAGIPQFEKYTDPTASPKEAMFYEKLPRNAVKCRLCPWECSTKPGERGICEVRENRYGKLITLSYSRVCSINIDPIEKKPFFHFLPGENALSIATPGCNFGCKFCQNWQISQAKPEDIDSFYIPPEGIVSLCEKNKIKIIAFTYSEPTIFYEYMLETAKIAKQFGIKTVVVTNGYINPEPLKLLCKYVSGIKIDLKAFNEDYYKNTVEGRLQPVLDSIKTIKQQKVHLEIVYLVVPALNDNPREIKKMCGWLKENVGAEVPLHFSRFFPLYKMQNYPATPLSTLENIRNTALACGLKYVYIGNVPNPKYAKTLCPSCSELLIERNGYDIKLKNIDSGRCAKCKVKIKLV